jgi:hypothetical protein
MEKGLSFVHFMSVYLNGAIFRSGVEDISTLVEFNLHNGVHFIEVEK